MPFLPVASNALSYRNLGPIRSSSVRVNRHVRLFGLASVEGCSTCAMCLETIRAFMEPVAYRMPGALHFGQGTMASFMLGTRQRGFQHLDRFLAFVQCRHRVHRQTDTQAVAQLIGNRVWDQCRPAARDWRACDA